jgi:hypothetical protein
VVALTLALGVLTSLSVAPASGQEDPYGNTTTTTEHPGGKRTCQLRTESGEVGSRATVTVKGVTRGSTIRVLFDGQPVAEAEATAPGSSPQVNVDIDFTVPPAEPGMHEVTAVGADFSASCRTSHGDGFDVVGEVLGAEVTRDGGGSSLPRTGLYLGALVAVAVGLLLVGRVLVTRSKRRAAASAGARARTGV